MEKFRYMYNSSIVLDECDKCGGIWVQDGELGKMGAFLEQQAAAKAGPGKVTVFTSSETAPAAATGVAKYAGRLQRVQQFLRGVTAEA